MSQQAKKLEDQAKELRSLLNEVEKNTDKENASDEKKANEGHRSREVDILNLPPRKEIHSNKKAPTHIKISVPFKRFLLILTVLLILMLGAYLWFGEDLIQMINNALPLEELI
ncbi:hypothetical protein [Virgibacillus salexigens]|uniref:hypothetical protein n=1 Tax=Virgibacillus salexigens TaxID=61016 RepID=UPI00190A10F3|nr:hypothetical protein [Virgibacillus salexigens]